MIPEPARRSNRTARPRRAPCPRIAPPHRVRISRSDIVAGIRAGIRAGVVTGVVAGRRAQASRCRRVSNSTTPVATDTLRLETLPRIGIANS